MRIKILLLVLPFFAFASEHGGANYDIIERALNFLLFFGILLYFIAKPLKDLYQSRIDKIAAKLESIQEKLRASKLKKDDALKRVEEAKLNASSLVETARKEAVNLAQKVKKDAELEMANIQKSFKDQKDFEERKTTKNVVSEILNDIFASDSLKVDQKELINIILKKVG
ncbi:F0F1 ATP synthase subunit B [Campylobacter curvus]|uniref:F0F1 ATP synthase subunit B n=1 Tax=Campylobacter curvus TaxID=200 RepID=UPI00036BD79E|nr:F0F1 ATP synthase subunit B [Campylobacter curvus]QKF61770.1 ATP synthase, F0 complex, b subunit [Campylobacter curvus]UEB50065.1 F0F1 ATP synthase subunit B [Campylobacter curvus]